VGTLSKVVRIGNAISNAGVIEVSYHTHNIHYLYEIKEVMKSAFKSAYNWNKLQFKQMPCSVHDSNLETETCIIGQ
jgi:hypothetical protein